MHLQPLQQHHAARRVGAQQQQQRLVRALPFQLPGQSSISSSISRKPTDQQQQQQQQQPAPAPAVTQQVVPFDPAAPSSVAVSSSLKFAKHLANVSNGCAPPMTRFESLGWLLFESKRLQASLLGPTPQQAAASSWLSCAQGVQLLEQIYLTGAAIAELGTADGLQPLSSSNGSRAIVSLDYSRLLERYLQQHGHLLSEGFWSHLHAYDDLQARAIHVATALETRCMVHAMLFDKLIERVGTESSAAAGAWGVGAGWSPQGSAPLATAITNTMINTTQQHSAPVTTQSTVASPSAVNSNSGNNSNVASSSQTAGAQPTVLGVWGWLGQVGAVFMLLCTLAGKVVQVVVAVVGFAKDVVVQLLMLRAVSAGAKAVAVKAGAGAQLQPAVAAAATAGTLPPADAVQARQLPGAATGPGLELLQHAPGAVPEPPAAGSLGAVDAAAPLQSGKQSTTAHCERPAHAASVQGPQQSHTAVAAVEPVEQQLPVLDASPPPGAAAQQQQQPRAGGNTANVQSPRPSPQQWLRGGGVRSGLRGGLGAAQQVLHRAAAKVGATAASIPTVLLQQQQQLQGSKPFKTGSGHLLYSLWSPAEAGLQELELEAAAGVQFADAGWGVRGGSGMGAAVRSAEECW